MTSAIQAQKLSHDYHGSGFTIGEQRASKAKPEKLKV
jgi:hypothetical protein